MIFMSTRRINQIYYYIDQETRDLRRKIEDIQAHNRRLMELLGVQEKKIFADTILQKVGVQDKQP